ncbi:glycosyltransferase [Geitlerinema sp. PCC 9228]|jgi:glycosyltransferase involved in cell wall biosynthesis|uniref:glycosyltransferase n=1 Tax=Geitlerinema sp. PCC 9228 TaxID=111611 RepID=UPI0008F9A240|nr:glycosyltransferase [Geitlerinema sp. PCC 9228]
MKTVVLIDTNHGGHHVTYMRFLAKSLLEMDCRVVVLYPQPREIRWWIKEHSPQRATHLFARSMQELQSRQIPIYGKLPRSMPVFKRPPQFVAAMARWQYAASRVRQACQALAVVPDLVFFNWLDNYFSYYLPPLLLDIIFPYKWSGIYFRPGEFRFGDRTFPIFNFPLYHELVARSGRCQALAILNEDRVASLQEKIGNPVLSFPDFTDEAPPDFTYSIAQEIKKQAGDRKIIGIIGSMSKRKGMVTLLEVAQKSLGEDWFFVFAGHFSQKAFHQDFRHKQNEDYYRILDILKNGLPNCYFHFDYIPDEPQFNALINTCDILFAAYENFPYSSNLLAKAAAFEKPIVVSQGYCMGNRVETFEMGATIEEGNVEQCKEALHFLCQQLESDTPKLRFDFAGYRNCHSVAKLDRIFQTILSQKTTREVSQPLAL